MKRALSAALLPTMMLSVTACRGGGGTGEVEPVPVIVTPASEIQRSASVRASGQVEARRSVTLAFQVAGQVSWVGPEEGQSVRAGEVIARIDSSIYQLQFDMAAAEAEYATEEYARARLMFDRGSLAPAKMDKAETAFRQATAQAELAATQLSYATLRAPLGGVVARREIEPGEEVAPGRPVFTIMDIDPVEITVAVPEADIGQVQVGDSSAVRIPALGGELAGRVWLVGVAADPSSRTYTTKIRVPNPDGRIRPGMIAEARIVGDSLERALTVPGQAVVRDPQGATLVYVYYPQQRRVYSRLVEVGGVAGQTIEILSGLNAGEPVVTGGQHHLRDGLPVTVQTTASSTEAAAPQPPPDSAQVPGDGSPAADSARDTGRATGA